MKRLAAYPKTGERGKRGFTLAELLVALALLAIIAAFAAPGIANYLRNMQQTRQDETARLLYAAAQNRLTYLSVYDPNGEYAAFRGLFSAESAGAGSAGDGGIGIGSFTARDGGTTVYCYRIAGTGEAEMHSAALKTLLGESGLLNVIEPGEVTIDLDLSLRFVLRVSYRQGALEASDHFSDANASHPGTAVPGCGWMSGQKTPAGSSTEPDRRENAICLWRGDALHAGVAAVDREDLTGHIAGLLGAEEDSRGIQLAFPTVSAHGDRLLGEGLEGFRIQRGGGQLGIEVARADAAWALTVL